MSRHRLFIFCVMISSAAAWGQAAAEYGLTVSKSAAATTAAGAKLNRETSARTEAAAASVNQALAGSAKPMKTAKPVVIDIGAPKRRGRSQVEAKLAPAPGPTSTALASGISIRGGSVERERLDAKYPRVVEMGAPTPPSAKAKPGEATAQPPRN